MFFLYDGPETGRETGDDTETAPTAYGDVPPEMHELVEDVYTRLRTEEWLHSHSADLAEKLGSTETGIFTPEHAKIEYARLEAYFGSKE